MAGSDRETGMGVPGAVPVDHPANPTPDFHPDPHDPHGFPSPARAGGGRWRWLLIGLAGAGILAVALLVVRPWLQQYLSTVSTDDAYVNGHVTSISARIPDTVEAVLVDDNDYVEPGTVLVRLDRTPYAVAVAQKRAALQAAQSNLAQARALVIVQEAKARGSWFSVLAAQEQVRYDLATLRSNVANFKVQQANLALAQVEYNRVARLVRQRAATPEELDQKRAALDVARQQVVDAEERVQRTRASLGLPPNRKDPTAIPKDINLEQDYSSVQTALSTMTEAFAQLGVPMKLYKLTPEKFHEQIMNLDPEQNLNRALDKLVEQAPATQVARAQVRQAQRDLEQAELNLGYTAIKAPFAGFVSQRSVNPGNHVQEGQSLMAVRALRDVWIDANFKETVLGEIKIGQPVSIVVDAYPHRVFHGRVSGFSVGTGASLSLLPPENATGNFVKVVQRLPVRIDLTEPNPPQTPLLIGLSVVPRVNIKAKPEGPHAGQRLRGPAPATAARP